jgi:cytochrome c-type biogenesis protein CcmH
MTSFTLNQRLLKVALITSLALLLFIGAATQPSYAAIEAVQFEDPATLQRYQSLIAELRCLVCQNQNLADSDAGLAKDLRRKTAEMLQQGKTDQEILDYMSDRYGDFVLYRPPLNLSTALIWVGPFVLLLLVGTGLLLSIRRRSKQHALNGAPTIDQQQRDEVRAILDNAPDLDVARPSSDTRKDSEQGSSNQPNE